MFADEFYLPRASLLCDAIDNVSATFAPKYLLDLPYITEFFNDEFLQSLDGSSYLSESIPAILPSLQIASKTYEAKLAIERQSLYDMQTVLNQKKGRYTYI